VIYVYTDGASSPDGTGGWAWASDEETYASGSASETTNQRMEMIAALEAMKAHSGQPLVIVSDSQYVVKCFNDKWYKKWLKNGWKNSTGADVANREIWEQMIHEYNRGEVYFEWIKGHSGNAMNDFVDALAVSAKTERKMSTK